MIEALKEVKDFQVALEVTAHKICQMMDWDYSEVWMVSGKRKSSGIQSRRLRRRKF